VLRGLTGVVSEVLRCCGAALPKGSSTAAQHSLTGATVQRAAPRSTVQHLEVANTNARNTPNHTTHERNRSHRHGTAAMTAPNPAPVQRPHLAPCRAPDLPPDAQNTLARPTS
jgi:hypothetical protein